MAIAAIDAVVADVVLVAERHRLVDRGADCGVAARVHAVRQQGERDERQQRDRGDAQDERETRGEHLRHTGNSLERVVRDPRPCYCSTMCSTLPRMPATVEADTGDAALPQALRT